MSFLLESWFSADLESCRTISLSENGADWYDFTLTQHRPVKLALADWAVAATLSGDLSLDYSFGYIGTEDDPKVRLSATGSFYVEMPYSLNIALGFASGQLGPATSFDSTTSPAAVCSPYNIQYEVPEAKERVSHDRFRFGREKAHVFVLASTAKLRQVAIDRQACANVDAYGAMWQGKLRASINDLDVTAYSSSNRDGVLDLFPHRIERPRTIGSGDRLLDIELEGTL